jgi:trimethylamine---corrinoid protein Co-methyltransferase
MSAKEESIRAKEEKRLPHEMPGLKSSLYRPLSPEAEKKVSDAAFRVLEESGVAVYSDIAFNAFKNAGAVVDESTRFVRLPKSLVEDAIASNPSSITLHARGGRRNAVLEENRVHYCTGGTAIYVLDPDTGERRHSEVRDVILNARMIEALKEMDIFLINVFPNELKDNNHIDINRFFHALDNTCKPVMGGIYTMEGVQKVVRMAEMLAGSPDALRAEPFVSFITLIISPFKIDKEYGDMTCYLAKENLPVVVPTEPICGTTSPITLAGNVLTHISETLAGIALVQCINKGAPGICGAVGSITNLRTLDHLAGPVERAMINAAVAQMAQYYKLPYYGTAGTTDAKEVEAQCIQESAISNTIVGMSGANLIHDSAGLMESDLTIAYPKLAIDAEGIGMIKRILHGIVVNDETLAADLMIEKGPTSDFMAERHTVDYMRTEFFIPTLANRDKRDNPRYNPEEDAMGRATAFVEAIRKQDPETCMDAGVRTKILQTFPEIVQGECA